MCIIQITFEAVSIGNNSRLRELSYVESTAMQDPCHDF